MVKKFISDSIQLYNFCSMKLLLILPALYIVVTAGHEPSEWKFQWPLISSNDGWNGNRDLQSVWNYQNPTEWSEFDNNNAWDKTASIPIKEWHYQEPVQPNHHVKSNLRFNNCITKKPRYLHTEVIYPNVNKNHNGWINNNEWTSNIRNQW
ncbi:unnamed protein product [Diamesa serratosioi]